MSSPISEAVKQVLEIYIDGIPALFASKYVAAAALVVVIYDWLLTLDDEVRLIYPGPVGLVKVFYIIVSSGSLMSFVSYSDVPALDPRIHRCRLDSGKLSSVTHFVPKIPIVRLKANPQVFLDFDQPSRIL
jgi:Family of unknown function (DUF6533)